VDPAGNRDAVYVMGRNVYNWYYLSPTPWDIILGTLHSSTLHHFRCYLRTPVLYAIERAALVAQRTPLPNCVQARYSASCSYASWPTWSTAAA
jgi:hypothetical protein